MRCCKNSQTAAMTILLNMTERSLGGRRWKHDNNSRKPKSLPISWPWETCQRVSWWIPTSLHAMECVECDNLRDKTTHSAIKLLLRREVTGVRLGALNCKTHGGDSVRTCKQLATVDTLPHMERLVATQEDTEKTALAVPIPPHCQLRTQSSSLAIAYLSSSATLP